MAIVSSYARTRHQCVVPDPFCALIHFCISTAEVPIAALNALNCIPAWSIHKFVSSSAAILCRANAETLGHKIFRSWPNVPHKNFLDLFSKIPKITAVLSRGDWQLSLKLTTYKIGAFSSAVEASITLTAAFQPRAISEFPKKKSIVITKNRWPSIPFAC